MEFNIGNRRFKLEDNGVIKSRAIRNGEETKTELWRPIKFCDNGHGYLFACVVIDGRKKYLRKHRILHLARNPGWDIFDNGPNNCIDHINRSRSDNSIENLRVVTNQQNQFNRSNVKGYTWNQGRKKWVASIRLNKVLKYLGGFETEEDARAAYLAAKEIYHRFDNELTTDELEEVTEYNESF